jgi:hypothetical protein
MDALVAQPERVRNLAHRSSRSMKAPDRVLIGDLSLLRVMLQADKTIPRLPSLAQQLHIEPHRRLPR